jgi:hypothetical protein
MVDGYIIIMVKILIVDKSGDIQQSVYKLEDESELYKKAGLKSVIDFEKGASWNVEGDNKRMYEYSVYGKTEGSANTENKYDFPPPIDDVLFFNKCVIVKKRNNKFKSLSIEEWVSVYEKLFGGFEDIGDESDCSEEKDDEYDSLPKTKSGYAADDFVVEDSDEDELSYNSEIDSLELSDDSSILDQFDESMNVADDKQYNTRSRNKSTQNDTVFLSLDDDYISDTSIE